jgi:hypothetical protein
MDIVLKAMFEAAPSADCGFGEIEGSVPREMYCCRRPSITTFRIHHFVAETTFGSRLSRLIPGEI